MKINNTTWIYWTDQCKLCTHRESCLNKGDVEKYMKELNKLNTYLMRIHNDIAGSIEFKCDYFYLDYNAYKTLYPSESC